MIECRKPKICIIAEGREEESYLKKVLLEYPCFNNYCFTIKTAKGNDAIPARYKYEYQSSLYDVVLIFLDVDKKINKYESIVESIGSENLGDKKLGHEIAIFANPVTLQIVVLHYENIALMEKGKKENSEIVERIFGITNYRAKEDQLKIITGKLFYRTYSTLKINLESISTDYHFCPSTNFLKFLMFFESDDHLWINNINKKIKYE